MFIFLNFLRLLFKKIVDLCVFDLEKWPTLAVLRIFLSFAERIIHSTTYPASTNEKH